MLLPAARLAQLVRLLREMREIEVSGQDSTSHAAHGIVRLVEADAGGLVLLRGSTGAAGNIIDARLAGFAPSQVKEVEEFYRRPASAEGDLAAMALVEHDARGTGLCRLRRQLVADREWYRSPFVAGERRRWRLDDSIYGGLHSALGNYTGIGLFRAWGARPFSEEDAKLAELFAEGASGAVFGSRGPELSPRQQETLQCLLSGDSAKQIAAKLGLSIHTVGEYVKAVYRAHGVSSRAELMVRLLGHPHR